MPMATPKYPKLQGNTPKQGILGQHQKIKGVFAFDEF